MFAQTSRGVAPGQHVPVGLSDRRRLAATQEVALEIVHSTLFDLTLMLRPSRPAGSNQKGVVPGTFPGNWLALAHHPRPP